MPSDSFKGFTGGVFTILSVLVGSLVFAGLSFTLHGWPLFPFRLDDLDWCSLRSTSPASSLIGLQVQALALHDGAGLPGCRLVSLGGRRLL